MRPNIDEVYEAFMSSTLHNLPESVHIIWNLASPYISKIKESIYDMVLENPENKLYLDFTKEKVNKVITDFISKQWFLTKPIVKPIMKSNYIDNIDNFIQSVKDGKNKYDKTTNALINIFFETFTKLSNKYEIAETKETISEKVKNIFI